MWKIGMREKFWSGERLLFVSPPDCVVWRCQMMRDETSLLWCWTWSSSHASVHSPQSTVRPPGGWRPAVTFSPSSRQHWLATSSVRPGINLVSWCESVRQTRTSVKRLIIDCTWQSVFPSLLTWTLQRMSIRARLWGKYCWVRFIIWNFLLYTLQFSASCCVSVRDLLIYSKVSTFKPIQYKLRWFYQNPNDITRERFTFSSIVHLNFWLLINPLCEVAAINIIDM